VEASPPQRRSILRDRRRATADSEPLRRPKGWHITLWIVQVMLGAAFVVGG
jgi:hypothetical protein